MAITVRPLEPERDAAGFVALFQEVHPYTTLSVPGWLQQHRAEPARARQALWVAVDDGELVGAAQARLNAFTTNSAAIAGVTVRASHRRRGLGTQLWELAEEHLRDLAAERVRSNFTETPAGVAFARARGFAESRADALASVDPRTVAADPGADVVALREVDPREVYDVDLATTPDVPQSDAVDDLPYEEWLDLIWRRPAITLDGSFGALVDGRLAAFALLAVNLDVHRGFNEYTCTLREFRGRGLAERVKRASLAWSAAQGIDAVWTTNDETNAPMLAVNRKLGYVTTVRRVEYVREAGTAS